MLSAKLFWMLVSHGVCDYPLQSGWMSEHKSPKVDDQWYYPMAAHSLTHGGGVALATGSVPLGIAETIAHYFIDLAKCMGWTSIHADQGLHVLCKLVWLLFLYWFGASERPGHCSVNAREILVV